MVNLCNDSKKKIETYVKKGYLNKEIIFQIWRNNNKKKIVLTLKEHLAINEITLTKVWLYVVQTLWKDVDSIFDKKEIILLKEILINDGVVLRLQIKNNSLNEYMTSKAIDNLYDRNIIDILSFSRIDKIIIIHPELRFKIFNENATTKYKPTNEY